MSAFWGETSLSLAEIVSMGLVSWFFIVEWPTVDLLIVLSLDLVSSKLISRSEASSLPRNPSNFLGSGVCRFSNVTIDFAVFFLDSIFKLPVTDDCFLPIEFLGEIGFDRLLDLDLFCSWISLIFLMFRWMKLDSGFWLWLLMLLLFKDWDVRPRRSLLVEFNDGFLAFGFTSTGSGTNVVFNFEHEVYLA